MKYTMIAQWMIWTRFCLMNPCSKAYTEMTESTTRFTLTKHSRKKSSRWLRCPSLLWKWGPWWWTGDLGDIQIWSGHIRAVIRTIIRQHSVVSGLWVTTLSAKRLIKMATVLSYTLLRANSDKPQKNITRIGSCNISASAENRCDYIVVISGSRVPILTGNGQHLRNNDWWLIFHMGRFKLI